MADETGSPFERVTWLRQLAAAPYAVDFHQAMRRLERAFPSAPRWGEAIRPREEPVRLGQDPFLAFAPSSLVDFRSTEERAPRLGVAFLGLFGPHGPLPLHLTEYVRERIRNFGDETLAAFADLFHHRILVLFHRAWAHGRPTASRDRRNADRFVTFVGALCGLGLPSLAGPGGTGDLEKLQFAGRFGASAKNPDGLCAVLAGNLELPVAVREFIGEWLEVPDPSRFRLGHSPEVSSLGRTTVLGRRVFSRAQKFRVVLGPLNDRDFARFLPNQKSLAHLSELVHAYAGRELSWDLELVPAVGSATQLRLGRGGRIGFNAVLGAVRKPLRRAHVIVDPESHQTERLL
jgi:type VI secretion system protein ImpH